MRGDFGLKRYEFRATVYFVSGLYSGERPLLWGIVELVKFCSPSSL